MKTLRSKITFFGLFICFFAGSVTSFYALKKNGEFFENSYDTDTKFKLESIVQVIQNNSEKIKSDALFLASTPPVKGILRATKNNGIDPVDGSSIELWKKRLEKIFEEMLYINSEYMQLRYIGVENNGLEIVRTERFGNKVISLDDKNLQEKGKKDYFLNTLKEYRYKVYFSKISPNKEFGKIVYPIQMVLRAGVPVFEYNQKPFGGIFINANYSTLFKGLDFFKRNTHVLLIKDENGRPLMSYNKGFHFYTDKQESFKHEDLLDLKTDLPNIHRTKLFYNDLNPNQYLTISLSLAENLVARDIQRSYIDEGFVIVLLMLAASIVSYFFARQFVKPLEKLHELTRRISRGIYTEKDLVYADSLDEVGSLNNALIDMAKDVQDSRKQVDDQKKALDSSAIVAETDARGRITYVNEKFIEVSGFSRGELIGQDHRILNSGFHDKVFFRTLWETIRSGLVWKGEVKNKSKDGSFYWVDTTIYPVRELYSEKIKKYIAIRLDITEQKKIQADYLNALETKSNFLANMSHEIRTPLNGILGFTDILLEKKLDNETLKEVSHIKNCSEGLLQIINDILDISKIESGKLEFNKEAFNIQDCIEKTISIVKTKLDEKNIDFEYKINHQVDNVLVGDEMRIRQVILNILSNAIKFSKDNSSIEMDVDLKDDNKIFQTVYFTVKDHGIGISKEQKLKLFDSFSQADSSISKKFGGTGLGLAITKKFIKIMNGDIWIDSQLGVGTTVHFTMKLPKSDVVEFRKSQPTMKEQNLKIDSQMDILIVEDNKTNQILLTKMLKKISDFNIVVVENGLQAIDAVKETSFQLVFMDVQMPVMDGLKATELLRKELRFSGVIVGLSANAFESDAEKGKSVGMDYYLSKPINSKKLNELFVKLKDEKDFVQMKISKAS